MLLKKCVLLAQKNNNVKYLQGAKNKCLATWNVINIKESNFARDCIEFLSVDNKTVKDPVDIAPEINNHFIDFTHVGYQGVNRSNPQLLKRINSSIFLAPTDPFETGKCTTLACFALVKEISNLMDKKIPVTPIFFDMSRAFDFVCHKTLLDKLEVYGIRGRANDLIADYLSGREQCVEVQNFNKDQEYVANVNRQPLNISVVHKDIQILESTSTKFLGIMLDTHLSWKQHVDSVCHKINRFVFALYRLKNICDIKTALTAYHGYVASALRYGIVLWGNCVEVDRVFIVQKRFTSIVTCKDWLPYR
ncbi:reverse transcriptase (RNA-dependent DNA polymerase) domain-containing protein [Phthorimaea operculella]|nr:reverse transcriptase (RNA-dependent DNA polymerase) domain-containing protein [Phthorimaea operculella]